MFRGEIGSETILMNKFEKILLTLFFVELFIGGGGRLIDFDFLSIRQVLFIGLTLTFLFRIIREKAYTNLEVNTFFRMNPITVGIYLLIGWFFVSALIGFGNGHAPSHIITDFFRVSFFAVYFPLAYYISETRFSKQRVIKILKYSAFAVGVFTILTNLLGKTIFYNDFEWYRQFLLSFMNDDLIIRNNYSIFYKSHFYVFVGFILALNAVLSKKYTKIDLFNTFLCALSLLLSETRGFLLAIMVSVLMILLMDVKIAIDPVKGMTQKIVAVVRNSQLMKKSIVLLLISISMPLLYQYMTLERYEQSSNVQNENDSRSLSDVNDTTLNVRFEFILDSKEILLDNPVDFIVGSGYGTEIAGRVEGIEMSFLDILVEQGALGLAIWFFLFLLVFYNYYYAYKRGVSITNVDRSLIGIFLGVLLLTNTNPFINNPIGIVFFLVVLILSRNEKEKAARRVSKS